MGGWSSVHCGVALCQSRAPCFFSPHLSSQPHTISHTILLVLCHPPPSFTLTLALTLTLTLTLTVLPAVTEAMPVGVRGLGQSHMRTGPSQGLAAIDLAPMKGGPGGLGGGLEVLDPNLQFGRPMPNITGKTDFDMPKTRLGGEAKGLGGGHGGEMKENNWSMSEEKSSGGRNVDMMKF